ncbi:Com family DNA-binding transcriptional regulator [Megamonas hypermegale]|uniref:Mu-like prophage protein Com n=1 Tax=Megamonas hypermegale TaxID=158847 RepID=A0A239TEI1_9FIRM|nr:Com family DNA-binding transcriptional regulator [Megamonas hypermegale]MDM8143063.1 Com family DNA-binding transcriptional regulator [Megamonas hypermegale]SNU95558.1 Mu-like prophage protein Com [Megamonas hypermegale]
MQNIVFKTEMNGTDFADEDTELTRKEIKKLPEVRCKVCNRLLFLGKVQYVEIKCPKCNKIQKVGRRINDICIKDDFRGE